MFISAVLGSAGRHRRHNGFRRAALFISYFYNRHKNILVVMWIHFLFDFLTQFASVDGLELLTYLAGTYAIGAVALVVLDRRRFFGAPEPLPAAA